MPTLPLLHGCAAAHSIVSAQSAASRSRSAKVASPSECQVPRGSALTIAYPRGHQKVGSGPSKMTCSCESHSARTPQSGKRP
jgi:hypothetical protein